MRWAMNNQKIEAPDEIDYLGVTFESNGAWKRQKLKITGNGNQILVATHKCLARTPDIRMKIFGNGMLNEFRMMYVRDVGPI
jgi:hypothetical protein